MKIIINCIFTVGEVTLGFTVDTVYIREGQLTPIMVESTVIAGEDEFDPPSLGFNVISVAGTATCKSKILLNKV